jgi:protein-tyrosine phosphatase
VLTAICKLPTAYCQLLTANYLCRMKILMVCLGNICRSPLAEGILQNKALEAGLNWQVDSAGTNGYHTGEPPHHLSIKVGKLNGIDISKQTSRRFTATDMEAYDIIYAMANDVLHDMKRISKNNFDTNKVSLFLEESFPGEERDVPDPWYGGEEGYHEIFEIINKNCDSIIKKYTTKK